MSKKKRKKNNVAEKSASKKEMVLNNEKKSQSPIRTLVVIAVVALAVYPFAQWARARRQERLNEELLRAARAGDGDELRRLLTRGADTEAKDRGGRTPLWRAAWHGHTHVAELLLAHGADANAVTTNGMTPLHAAGREGRTDVAQLLVAEGVDVDASLSGGHEVRVNMYPPEDPFSAPGLYFDVLEEVV